MSLKLAKLKHRNYLERLHGTLERVSHNTCSDKLRFYKKKKFPRRYVLIGLFVVDENDVFLYLFASISCIATLWKKYTTTEGTITLVISLQPI